MEIAQMEGFHGYLQTLNLEVMYTALPKFILDQVSVRASKRPIQI